MEKIVRRVVPFILIYAAIVICGIGALFLVSKLPQSWLAKNWEENRNTDISTNYFHLLVEDNYATLVDDYTDNMKIDIAYRLNEQSVFLPSAYVEGMDFHYDYGRYWQGYCVVLRPLLIFFNLNQIRILYGILIVAAFLALVCVLIKRKQWVAVIALTLAVYLCNFYMTALSLQYFNCTFIALTASALILYQKPLYTKWKCLCFFVIGMLVNYFDFLTFETLTLSLPLLLAEVANDEKITRRIRNVVLCAASWFAGYVVMFSTKCLLYISVNKGEAVEMLKYKITQRTIGTDSTEQYTFDETLKLTLSCLKGIDFANYKTVVIIVLLIFLILVMVRILKKVQGPDTCIMMLLVGLIPFVRFFLIREHSSSHFYLAYYALFTTAISVTYVIIEFLRWIWRKL